MLNLKSALRPASWSQLRLRWHHSTIFSLSSGHGKCGVSIIRVSGPQSLAVVQSLAHLSPASIRPRYAYLRTLRDPATNAPIDRGLVLWFPGPHSFTGEDSCEFQVHGGPAVVAAMLRTLSTLPNIPNVRPAAAGEFTKRAFYAGKLDLTAVEGLADLIHAETEQQRRQALLQADGALSRLYAAWRQRVLRSCAHLEAYIDFAEDQHLEAGDMFAELRAELRALCAEIETHLRDGRRGERLRSGVRTAIVGAPNVGKSSLMNWLCGREISIVTPVAGTTRDVVERGFDVAGWPVLLADTAGLRSADDDDAVDVVEREGIERARRWADDADLVIVVMDAERLRERKDGANVQRAFAEYLREIGMSGFMHQNDVDALQRRRILHVVNKIDLLSADEANEWQTSNHSNNNDVLFVSCLHELGMLEAVQRIAGELESLCGTPSAESPVLSQHRHRHHVTECLAHLRQFVEQFTATSTTTRTPDGTLHVSEQADTDLAIGAHRLRRALHSIGQITGEASTEDVLDVIFRDFCIGK